MKLVQKLLTTISFNLELQDRVIALEVLRDIRDYYGNEKVARLVKSLIEEIRKYGDLNNE